MKKVCFVTVGATASFDSLVQAILDQQFLSALNRLGYTDLRFQYGRDEASLNRKQIATLQVKDKSNSGLIVTGYDFKTEGFRKEFLDARTGVVISHAGTNNQANPIDASAIVALANLTSRNEKGSGTVLEALRLSVPIIVVPNPTLLNNHQEELAKEMEHQGYAVHGKLHDLVAALGQAETLRKEMQEWPPKGSRGDGRGLVGIMDDELGFVG